MRAALRFIERQVRSRPLACFSVAFLLGLMLRQRYGAPTALCALGTLLACALCFALRRHRWGFAALLLIAGLLTGMTRMGLALNTRRDLEPIHSAQMVGRVASEPFTNMNTGRRIFRFDLETVDNKPSGLHLRMYLRSTNDGETALSPEAIEYGQRLCLTGHIWNGGTVSNPHEFDFDAYLARQGLEGYGTAKMKDVTILGLSRDWRSRFISVRRAIGRRIDALFPNSAGMMRALVLGDRSMLSDELRSSLSRTGTAHLISISGLHVTVLSTLLAFVLSRLMSRRTACMLTIALLVPYGVLIGFTAAFVRAMAMFAILSLAPTAGLPSDPITRLCAAMLGWLLARPLSIGDAGFALSFSASAGILLLMPPIMTLTGVDGLSRRKPSPVLWVRALHRLEVYILTLLCASLAAQLGTLPTVVSFFGVQSVVSIPFNLICVPLCMLGYVLGIFALLLSAVLLPVAATFARIPDALLCWLTTLTRSSAVFPSAIVRIGRYPFALVLLHWIVAITASDLCGIRPALRRWLPIGLVGVAALSSLLVFMISWNPAVVFLDAGQADSALFRVRGHTYLMDTGDTHTPVAGYLNATCLHLDGVILSHPHEDHAGGLSDVLNNFRPDVIYVPRGWFDVDEVSPAVAEGMDRAQDMGVKICELEAGDHVDLPGGAALDIYSPLGDALPEEVNDLSLLAMLSCRGQRILFTGDLSAEGEPLLIPDTDVLKVAHHGSERATSDRFLAADTPDIAVISVGENDYGHPRPATLEKLANAGASVYRTDQCGSITMTLRGGTWQIDTFREVCNEVE